MYESNHEIISLTTWMSWLRYGFWSVNLFNTF
jgi:hypothetical protein